MPRPPHSADPNRRADPSRRADPNRRGDPSRRTDLERLALNARERQVLQAIVQQHIAAGEPIGSKVLASELEVSSATVRNVMAALHERGLISKAHASAGRVPTDAGFRFYVDALLHLRAPSDRARAEIAQRVGEASNVEQAVAEAGKVLARLSQKACLVRAPGPEAVRIRQLELVRLRDDACLAVLVTTDGGVLNRLIELKRDDGLAGVERLPDSDALTRMARYLTSLIDGSTLSEARPVLRREVTRARDDLTAAQQAALQLGEAAIADVDADERLVVEGERHLLKGPDVDVDRVEQLMRVLDEKTRVLELLERAEQAPGIRIFIGEESELHELADMTVVTSSYGTDQEVFGTLGVIGPVRMDYDRVVPLVELTARMISEVLGGS